MKQRPSHWTVTFKNYEPQVMISYLEVDRAAIVPQKKRYVCSREIAEKLNFFQNYESST